MTFPTMPIFYAGERAFASDLEIMARRIDQLLVAQPSASGDDSAVTDGTTTSTSFTNSLTTTGIRGNTFTAPSSGSVYVIGEAQVRNSGAGGFVLIEFEVRDGNTIGSGTVRRAAQEHTAGGGQSDSANQQIQGVTKDLVTGLTAGNVYNVAMVYRVTAGTGTINRRSIDAFSVA